MNYKIKYIERNGEKIDLIFEFNDQKENQILPIFLYSEVVNFYNDIKCQLESVLRGEKKHNECSGNSCYWNIGPQETLIVDNFANEGEPSEITVDTQELRRLIDEWIAARDKFRAQKTKGEI